MRHISILAMAGAVLFISGSANATTVVFGSYQTALNPHETLVTDFSSGLPNDATGTATLDTGSQTNFSAAPATNATTKTAAQYMNVGAGQSETFTFDAAKEISFYAGSLDTYNAVSFSNGQSFNGSQIAALSGASVNGDQSGPESNGRFTFNLDTPATSISFSSGVAAFEISDLAISAVPEPGIWAMMLVGIALIGAALRFNRKGSVEGLAT